MSPIVGVEPEPPDRLAEWQARFAALPRWQRWVFFACGVFIPAVPVLAVAARESPGIVDARAGVVLVAPFAPTPPDTALERLGRDLVITLSANLEGVGGIRAADGPSVLAQLPPAAPPRDSVGAIARRVGASGAVLGTVTRSGAETVLELELVPVEEGRLGKAFARARVTGPADDPARLTDAAAGAVLRAVWQEGLPPMPTLAAITTPSPAALRAYLEGERAAAVGRWGDAARAFERATTADSTFWLAYWRRAQALRRNGDSVPRALVAVVRDNRSRLPRRDQLLVESEMAAGLTARLAFLQDATRRFPDAGWGWFALGDVLVHEAPLLGYDYAQAQTALARATALLPGFRPAWSRLEWTYLMTGDTGGSRQALEALRRLELEGAPPSPAGPERATLLLAADQTLRGTLSDALVDRVAREAIADSRSGSLWPAFVLTWLGYPAAQQRVSARVLALGAPGQQELTYREGVALAWAARGAWDSALVAMDRVARSGGSAIAPYRLAVIGVLVGAVDTGWARRRGAALSRTGRSPAQVAELAWLDGILGAITGDRPAIDTASRRLAASGDDASLALGYSLRAFQAALERDLRGAGRIMARIEWELADEPWDGAEDHPALRAVDRLAGARWLIATGDTTQARRMLVGWQRWAPGREPVFGWMLAPQFLIELARLEVAGARLDRAQEYYARFLRRYDRPVPGQEALVAEARSAVAAPLR